MSWKRIALVAFTSIVTIQASLSLWGLSLVPGKINYDAAGHWGDWVAGIGSLSAVSIALWEISNARRSEQERRQVEELARMSNVRFWVEQKAANSRVVSTLNILNEVGTPIFEWKITDSGEEILSNETESPLVPGSNEFFVEVDYAQRKPDQLRLVFKDAQDHIWQAPEFSAPQLISGG